MRTWRCGLGEAWCQEPRQVISLAEPLLEYVNIFWDDKSWTQEAAVCRCVACEAVGLCVCVRVRFFCPAPRLACADGAIINRAA